MRTKLIAIPSLAAPLVLVAACSNPDLGSRTYFERRIAPILEENCVRGTAEGMVGTERRTVRLAFEKTTQPGVYALKRQWPADGRWALVISTGPATGAATALVSLDARNATVAAVTVPVTRQDGWNVPRAVTRAEVDALLRADVARAGR